MDMPFAELYEAGLLDYQGMFSPPSVDEVAGVKNHDFDPDAAGRGPICIEGEAFRVHSRAGSSNDLFIFLQRGWALRYFG